MIDKAVDVLKQEEETLGTPLSKLLEPDTPPKEAISKATVDLQESLKGFIEAKVQKIMETQPQTVKVVGQPQVIVKFPEVQKTEGNVSVKGPVESHIKNWPSFGDIFKSAFAAIRFPDLQKITGDVTAKILNFPDVFKVSGKVEASVKFPEIQKVEGKTEVTNLPTGEGEEAGRQANPTKYVPVRLTNGKMFYDAVSGMVSSNGRVSGILESISSILNRNRYDSNNNLLISLATLIAGEDITNDVLKVEGRYSTSGVITADTQVKASSGFVHTVTFAATTATPTAGLITVYDNTAESGTVLYREWVFATVSGHSVTLDMSCGTGIYVGFDATAANISVTVSYR